MSITESGEKGLVKFAKNHPGTFVSFSLAIIMVGIWLNSWQARVDVLGKVVDSHEAAIKKIENAMWEHKSELSVMRADLRNISAQLAKIGANMDATVYMLRQTVPPAPTKSSP